LNQHCLGEREVQVCRSGKEVRPKPGNLSLIPLVRASGERQKVEAADREDE